MANIGGKVIVLSSAQSSAVTAIVQSIVFRGESTGAQRVLYEVGGDAVYPGTGLNSAVFFPRPLQFPAGLSTTAMAANEKFFIYMA